MKRIMFVDDEPNILDGLKRMMRSMRREWDMHFAESGEAGLELLDKEHFDIVVSDMKMPGMDGAEFLTEVKQRNPESIRIILSGQSEKAAVMKSVGPTHQFLSKPCEPDVLRQVIERAHALRGLLASDRLKALVSGVDSLPTLPSLYKQVVDELQKPNCSLPDVGKIIEQDIGMSAKILKLVNSSFFGLLRPVNSVERAVTFLGLETINALVIGAGVFQEFEAVDVPGFSLEEVWQHSMLTASFVRSMAATEIMNKQLVNDAYMAAVLHDVGKLVLVTSRTDDYAAVLKRVKSEQIGTSEIETEILGATHAEIGAYLIGLWGLPDSIVEAIAYHGNPMECPHREFNGVTLVHAADRLANNSADTINAEYIECLGMGERLPVWIDACSALSEQETA